MAVIYGKPRFLFGIPNEIKKLKSPPVGNWEFRLSPKDFVKLRVSHQGVVRVFVVQDRGDHWELGPEQKAKPLAPQLVTNG